MEQQPDCACERTKSKQKQNQVKLHSNWPQVLLIDLAHKQCNGIKDGLTVWRQNRKEDFLLNSILDVWLSIMSGHNANSIFLNKKNKYWTSRKLANPSTPTSKNISFFLYLHPTSHPLEADVIHSGRHPSKPLPPGKTYPPLHRAIPPKNECWSTPYFLVNLLLKFEKNPNPLWKNFFSLKHVFSLLIHFCITCVLSSTVC